MQHDSPKDNTSGWYANSTAALVAARAGDWKLCQQFCTLTAERQSPALMTVSRLNILVCQYQLGFTDLIPERALPLIDHLPKGAAIACLGLSLLAARKSGTLPDFKKVALALADESNKALDLPTIPTFVLLHEDGSTCTVIKHADGALMSEVISTFLKSGTLDSSETAMLQSLAKRYGERAALTAASSFQSEPNTKRRAWWKLW